MIYKGETLEVALPVCYNDTYNILKQQCPQDRKG